MTDTPRPLRKLDSNPPPLDLDGAGPITTDESSPELRATIRSFKSPMAPADVATVPQPNRNVTFKGASNVEASVPSPRSQAQAQDVAVEPRSSEEVQTDSSTKPLYGEAGPSKPRSLKNNLKPSPRLTFSPRLENAIAKPSKSAARSLRMSL